MKTTQKAIEMKTARKVMEMCLHASINTMHSISLNTDKTRALLEKISKEELEAINEFACIFKNVNGNNEPDQWEVWLDIFSDFVFGFDQGWKADQARSTLPHLRFYHEGHYAGYQIRHGDEGVRKKMVMAIMYSVSGMDNSGLLVMRAMIAAKKEERS